MIGVIANASDHAVVAEFFELFKTPWEFFQGDRRYEVVLCAGEGVFCENIARLVVIYGGRKLSFDAPADVKTLGHCATGRILVYKKRTLPIYGHSIALGGEKPALLVDAESGDSAGFIEEGGGTRIARIGYDLFSEIRTLLTVGQPLCNASIPALDYHIAILRDVIRESKLPLIEIPPVPEGYKFIACLTHDVDHPSIRRHRFDHTAVGFLYRAVVRSVFLVLQRRMSVRDLLINWVAALKLPFVYLGLAKDFWQGFDRYFSLEGGLPSSFFVIPFKGYPGRQKCGEAPKYRASGYSAADIADQLRALNTAGCEIGLHGIDAWHDAARGRQELAEIGRLTGVQRLGVRIHWLYWDEGAPSVLEAAGADYDSSVGYNETIGYRAGTTQVYRPLGVSRLLELPLHIMDTALFLPSHLGLSMAEAHKVVNAIIDNAVEFGGVVTVNWHDRSIAPERLWGNFYALVVESLTNRGAWFANAGNTVDWFRQRRSAVFKSGDGSHQVQVRGALGATAELPALSLHIHGPSPEGSPIPDPWRDLTLIDGAMTVPVPARSSSSRSTYEH
jgi:hypothetical protein